jgi:adenylosuccinate lyase
VHFGATSYDIISTALALQYKDATQKLIIPRLKKLVATLVGLSEKYANTIQVGRTHGQHAVPITFGFALAQFVSRLAENIEALQDLSNNLPAKFSGATGSYNALSTFVEDPLKFEADVLAKVGLKPSEASTQIAPAESLIRLFDEMTISAGIMSNLGHDMRNLQRSEIAEVREKFEEGQTGSSTMAHKRNPWNFENVASLNKQVLAQNLNAQLNISSEHQRDLTDSASSRFYPVLVGCVAEMARRLNTVMTKIEVDEENMKRNLEMSGGAIAAEPAYLLLAKSGVADAHEKIKELAIKAQDNKQTLAEVIQNELADFWSGLTPKQQQVIAEPEKYYIGKAAEKTKAIIEHWK